MMDYIFDLIRFPVWEFLRASTNILKWLKIKKPHEYAKKKSAAMRRRLIMLFLSAGYTKYVLNYHTDKSKFVPIAGKPYKGTPPVRAVAFYLPQFYQIEQNDIWFGRGFTEWTNVTRTVPQFIGHEQPRLPIDVGFYNLETTKIMRRQIELAKMYGIGGFCFYWYWFRGGERIMEQPVYDYLDDKSLDFPFMFFWANENWTNNWDTVGSHEKAFSADVEPYEADKFAADIVPFFMDERYIKIDGRPVLQIYKHQNPKIPDFIKNLLEACESRGCPRPYIMLITTDIYGETINTFNPRNFGADAAAEFAVHMIHYPPEKRNLKLVNENAILRMRNMDDYIASGRHIYDMPYPLYKSAMTGFDNTSRKIYRDAWIFPISPAIYKQWLSDNIKWTLKNHSGDKRILFLSAWNEWAECMVLEPCQRYGYAYLQATGEALKENEQ